jgi:hypothetical protein
MANRIIMFLVLLYSFMLMSAGYFLPPGALLFSLVLYDVCRLFLTDCT